MSEETPKCEPNPALQVPVQKMEGTLLHCSFYGCKQTFTDVQKLTSHTQSHQIPTQSLPGKVFQCSALGCTGSFPNMQQLMEHMRRHYKPNHYFLCESCRSRLRSYRALLKHLHNCAKVAKSKAAKVAEVTAAAHVADAAEFPTLSDVALSDTPLTTGLAELSNTPQSQGEEAQMKSEPNLLPVDSVLSAALPTVPGLQASVSGLLLDPSAGTFSPLEQPSFSTQPQNFPSQPDATSSSFSADLGPLNSSPPPLNAGQQEQQQEQQQRALWGIASSPPASVAPPTPLGSNAVWRKNQDESGPVLHRRNSPCSSQSLSTGEFQASLSAVASYGSTQGGAIDVYSVATPPLPGRR